MNETRLEAVLADLHPEKQGAVDHVTAGWRTPNGGVRLTIIDGPPGTGKTHIAAAAAGQWVRTRGSQVVILTPTHQAAAHARGALIDVGFDPHEALRFGPGPVGQPTPGFFTFDRLENLPDPLLRQVRQARVYVTPWQGSQRAFGSQNCRIISSNCLLLLDEVSQIPYSAFLALLRRIRSALGRGGVGGIALLGDPHQLPVITTQDVLATNAALGILRRHPECTPHRLVSQYRMNTPICEVVNVLRRTAFAGLPLRPADDTIASRTLDQIAHYYSPTGTQFSHILDPAASVVFVDTTPFATEGGWSEVSVGDSWIFEPEARFSFRLAEAIRQVYKGISLMILSPYRPQAATIRALGTSSALTIYRAQGREWDCVILTLARTNILGRCLLDEIYQHTYVGLSRARAKLIVLLHADVFRQFRLFGALLEAARSIEGVRLVRADPEWGRP